ncbi:serine/threonine-protein kinase PrkC-like [Haliotis rubra]|uniref:serine/threonine-protein kinase PrkC-like n=1 Tax=Haliotis rubra TaxID=36100 RepID=UPI001EE54584|nr:serine/threonine-protein kinase PrkC-like [Haliotis rubra]
MDEATITLPVISQEYLYFLRSDGEEIWLRHSGETKIALAHHKPSNADVVIKMFKDSSFVDIRHEATVNYIMGDTGYVPEFLGLTQSGSSLSNLSIVQEYFAEGQTLQDTMCLVHKFDLQVKLVLAIQLAEAMSSFHQRDFIISNFKTDNILFDFVDNYPVIKLIDLGKCTLQYGYTVSKSDDLDSLDYLAPELKDGGVTSFAADVYGLGVILRDIFEGCVDVNATGLIKRCMEEDPRLRPSAEEAAGHIMDILSNMNERHS